MLYSPKPRKVFVNKVIIHFDYNITTPWRDIALLKLAERIDLFDFPPACLPGQDDIFNEKRGLVYGKFSSFTHSKSLFAII